MKRMISIFFLFFVINCTHAQQYELKYNPENKNSETELFINHTNIPQLQNPKQSFILKRNDKGLSDLGILTDLGVNEYTSLTGVSHNMAELINKYEAVFQSMKLDKAFTMHGREGLDIIYTLFKKGDSYKVVLYLGEDAAANAFLLEKK